MQDAVSLSGERLYEAARRYAAADKSDPFALVRALSHIRSGLCGPCEASDMLWCNGLTRKSKMAKIGPPEGSDGHYDARRVTYHTDYVDIKRL